MEISPFDVLLQILAQLDRKLEEVVMREHAFPASAEGEQEGYQGLYISQEEVLHSLAQESVSRLFHPIQLTSPTLSPRENNLVRLMHCFALSPFDMDILLLALAPELDLRYERIYAYLQDDIAQAPER